MWTTIGKTAIVGRCVCRNDMCGIILKIVTTELVGRRGIVSWQAVSLMVRRMLLQMRVIERVESLADDLSCFLTHGCCSCALHRKWPFEGKSWCSGAV